LLHKSEISHSRIHNVEDVYKEGDEVKVKLIGIDPKTGKLRLSRKALLDPPPGGGDRRDDRRDNRRDGGRNGGDRKPSYYKK